MLWWLYIDYRLYGNGTSVTKEVKEEAEPQRDNGQALLVYAIAATVFTVRRTAVLSLLSDSSLINQLIDQVIS